MKKGKKESVKIKIGNKEKKEKAKKFIPKKLAISWQAPEFEHHRKGVSWYWLSLIFAIVLVSLAIWQKNFLFAVFVIIAWLIVIYSSRRPPLIWNFIINEEGIQISLSSNESSGVKFYNYEEIYGFDIHPLPREEYKELAFKVKKKFSPYLKINFLAEDEEKIKKFLENYIPKEEYPDSLADSLSKLIKL
jgi:hypothetical protein